MYNALQNGFSKYQLELAGSRSERRNESAEKQCPPLFVALVFSYFGALVSRLWTSSNSHFQNTSATTNFFLPFLNQIFLQNMIDVTSFSNISYCINRE